MDTVLPPVLSSPSVDDMANVSGAPLYGETDVPEMHAPVVGMLGAVIMLRGSHVHAASPEFCTDQVYVPGTTPAEMMPQ